VKTTKFFTKHLYKRGITIDGDLFNVQTKDWKHWPTLKAKFNLANKNTQIIEHVQELVLEDLFLKLGSQALAT
jgi:hypothetical protein